MARKRFAYISSGDTAFKLGVKGIEIYISAADHPNKKEAVVGTLFVAKAGIRWLPKRGKAVLKGKHVAGYKISWDELTAMVP
ncbi:MAG: hypothetical protein L3J68_00235 [Thermoplasmata archaeon]|nr:hypothetical protein [Thermoplasmata archaeon]